MLNVLPTGGRINGGVKIFLVEDIQIVMMVMQNGKTLTMMPVFLLVKKVLL